MNTTKLYQIITENKNGIEAGVYDVLLGIVKEELAKECEKAAGRKANVRNSVKKFIDKSGYRDYLTKGNIQVINGTTYYGYCDGFKLAWSPIDFGFGTVEGTGNALQWDQIINYRYKNPGTVEINKADVIEHIKKYKGQKAPYTVEYGNGMSIDLNPDFLKACMDFTEVTTMTVDLGNDSGNYPVFFHNDKEDRHAMCLPIRR